METAVTSAPTTPEYPEMRVAHAMDGRGPILGLERALPLLGGGVRLAPDGIALAPGIDHVPMAREHVVEACRRQSDRSRDWYSQAPLALVGSEGTGRSLLVNWIARATGVPLFRTNASHFSAPTNTDRFGVGLAIPPFPAIAMAASRCANPVIAVDLGEGHELDEPSERSLASMISPASNERWLDSGLQTIFDFSQISWIIILGSKSPRPAVAHLDRDTSQRKRAAVLPILEQVLESFGRMVSVKWLGGDEEKLRRLAVAAETCASPKVHPPPPRVAIRAVFEALLEFGDRQVAIETLRNLALREVESLRSIGW